MKFEAIKIATIALLFVLSSRLEAQKVFRYEVQIENDNDAYTLNLTRDQYYSNGAYVRFRYLTDSTKWSKKIDKTINTFHVNHRIFSPQRLFWTDSALFDRPYAGQMSAAFSKEYYLKNESYLKAQLEIGWMGPSLRIGQLQYEWHKAFGMQLPQGWKYQIGDAPIVNLWGTYAHKLIETSTLDIITETNLAAGTTFSHLREEFVLRLGKKKKSIQKSTQYNGLLNSKNTGPGVQEFYFFISPGVEYVVGNSTIEGNRIGNQSPHIEEIRPWVYQTRAGVFISWTQFDLGFLYYRRSKETTKSTYHKFVGIRLNQRF